MEVELLALLSSKLDERGLAYEVAAETTTTDLEAPADVDGESVDVRLTDRTAVLVRDGVETSDARTGTFEAAFTPSLSGIPVPITRGYCVVDAVVGDAEVTVATTHLEAASADPRRRQAEELLEVLPDGRPVCSRATSTAAPAGRPRPTTC